VIRIRDLARVQQRGRVGVGGINVASLEQQNRPRGILAKAGREDHAGGATADNNHVGGLGQVRHVGLLVRLAVALGR